MRLSTSTNIYFNRPAGRKAEIKDSIRLCARAGYRVMDMNFYDCTTFGLPFVTARWEHWINEIKAEANQCQMEFNQAHANFYNFCDRQAKDKEFLDQMVLRSITCSSILGAKWVVIHAGTDFSSSTPIKDSKQKNREYFKPVLEWAARHEIGIAIENLWDLNIAPKRRYTVGAEELVDFVDTLKQDYDQVGICWDVEHAAIMRQDQRTALKLVGERLKATHISDFTGTDNDHILPFSGNMDWPEIMASLREINYQGDLTYEIHRYTQNMPDALVPDALAYSVKVGNYLLALAAGQDGG